MRIIVDAELQQVAELTEDNIFSSGAIQEDSVPDTPFAVIRMGVRNTGMSDIYRQNFTIWVHDEPGDYTRIDRIVQGIYGRLDGAEHRTVEEVVGEMILCQWQSTGDDTYDPGFRTISRNITFAAVGTGA